MKRALLMPEFPKPAPLNYDVRTRCNRRHCRGPSDILLCGIGFCDPCSNKVRARIGEEIPGGNRLAYEVFQVVKEEVRGWIRHGGEGV